MANEARRIQPIGAKRGAYLDISTDDQIKAMATLEDENDSKVSAKWKNNNGSLKSLVARQ